MSEERFDRIEKTLTSHGEHLTRHDARFDEVTSEIKDLRRHMGVLHEATLDAIAASSERNAVTKPQLDEAVRELKETIGRRLDPLEAAVRTHSAEISVHTTDIAELKRTR